MGISTVRSDIDLLARSTPGSDGKVDIIHGAKLHHLYVGITIMVLLRPYMAAYGETPVHPFG